MDRALRYGRRFVKVQVFQEVPLTMVSSQGDVMTGIVGPASVAGMARTRTRKPFGAPVFKTGSFPIRIIPVYYPFGAHSGI